MGKKRERPEDALQRAAVDYLRLVLGKRYLVLHVPNGGQRSPLEAAILKGLGVLEGAADILISGASGSWWIELKAPDGRLRPSQERFRDDCRERGIPWAECRDLDEVQEVVKGWGLLRTRAAA